MRTILAATAFVLVLLAGETFAQSKFSGYMFGDYFYNVARDSGIASIPKTATGGEKSFQAFQIRRIYFTYDNDISEHFVSRFRLEADQVSNTTDGKIGVAVKDAFLRWKEIFQGSDMIFGIQPTSAYDVSEGAWGYRSLEKTIMDLRGIVPSRDLGVALKGKLDNGGTFGYWVMVANGTGNKPETDKYKRYSLMLSAKPSQNLQMTLYGDYSDAGNKTNPYSTSTPKAAVSNGALTSALFVGYTQPGDFSIGAEGFLQSTMNGFNDVTNQSLKSANAIGISVFGSVSVATDIAVVGRYDFFDPNSNSNSKGDSRNYFIGSLVWKPDKNVSIMPNVLVETYEKLPNGHTFDPSVTGRLTFYYVFL
jgi:hypothetical protein